MSSERILVERRERVAVITINRPDRRNAFLNDMVIDLRQAMTDADNDEEVRVIVITGAGSSFSSGADVDAFKEAFQESQRQGRQVHSIDQDHLQAFAVALRQIRKPLIAAINGPAVGLGFTLALACDMRIASEQAQMGAIFARVGLSPEFGSSYYLARLVGVARACEIVFTARIIDAHEADRIGLVNRVVPPDRLMDETMDLARQIIALPPMAIQLSKANLYSGLDSNLFTQSHEELMANRILRETRDYAEGITAFIEKRKPSFVGQ